MSYLVKEVFLTLQGEGFQAGAPAVFCRFTGCNLWTGREEHRASAVCQFCDTDFVGTDGPGGGKFATADDLADHIAATWTGDDADANRLVVCTGGEPLLQLDQDLVDALHARRFRIAIETNGTLLPPDGIDWICMSPKAGADLVLTTGDELKLVYPQPTLMPGDVGHLDFAHRFLQPMDGPDRAANTEAAIAHCLAHPRWRLSVQTHKYLGIP
ncbi:MAG: queE [Ilumatobacteraceae bacterium]|nr:queE [Ilumatobacteraceae bacterium]